VYSIFRASFEEAEHRRTSWVGFDHLLAAIAEDPEESKARAALRACGLDESVVADYIPHIKQYVPPIEPLEDGERPSPNPHWYRLVGRAEGFAFGANSQQVLAEHVLLALIWDDSQPSLLTQLLQSVGQSPLDLQTALGRLGVQVPAAAPPVG
jgi:ATP-dependent Clp protease ATP-binding subunit ClpA